MMRFKLKVDAVRAGGAMGDEMLRAPKSSSSSSCAVDNAFFFTGMLAYQ
jgi:hypothetical protein